MGDHVERYDRQIRLWGQHGQNKCSDARVCLVNADSLGVEILKGLCLAGISSFSILDSHKLMPEDIGSIFIRRNCIGQNRGEVACQMLLQLNSDVKGEVYPLEQHLPPNINLIKDVQEGCDRISFWKHFDVVIVTSFLNIDQIIGISKICWSLNIPLLFCRSLSFFGLLRCQIQEHLVVETHPDNPLPDFSLDDPFSDLKNYLESVNLEDPTKIDEINTYPYIVVVYYYLKKWQDQNSFPRSRLPKTYQEKSALKAFINEGLKKVNRARSERHKNEEQAPINLDQGILFENFSEANKAVNSCFSVSSELPQSVVEFLNHPKVSSTSDNRSTFWSIIAAIKEFVYKNNELKLPVSGTIPDMISSSEEYLRLQNIYTKKSREDVESVFNIVQNLVSAGNNSPGQSLYEETKLICKNIRDLRIIRTTPICDEYESKSLVIREDGEDDECMAIYLGFRALDSFYSTYGRLPGRQADQVETDVAKLKYCLKQTVGQTSNKLKTLDQTLYELSRCGGAELHATSAFVGGCIAQEAIKFITNQYLPIDDSLVYNAMTTTTRTFRSKDVMIDAK